MKHVFKQIALAACMLCSLRLVAQEQSTTIGGYGDVHMVWMNDHAIKGGKDTSAGSSALFTIDRFVVFLAHNFNDWISFRSELEVENTKIAGDHITEAAHNGVPGKGEVSVEQLYLDFMLSKHFNVRAGLVLVPMGIINEFHEPPSFNGVSRPFLDLLVIPTTWRDIGAGAYGEIAEGWNYRAYIMAGMNGAGFDHAGGPEGAKYEGQESNAKNLALTGRLEYSGTKGLRVGAAFYTGGTSGGDIVKFGADGDGLFAAPMTAICADVQYTTGDLALRGQYATISISGDKINKAYHTDSTGALIQSDAIPNGIGGFYFEAAYNIMKALDGKTSGQLSPFVRYESFDLNQSLAAGQKQDDALKQTGLTVGLTYKPAYNVSVKADWQSRTNKAFSNKIEGAGAFTRVSLGLGYNF